MMESAMSQFIHAKRISPWIAAVVLAATVGEASARSTSGGPTLVPGNCPNRICRDWCSLNGRTFCRQWICVGRMRHDTTKNAIGNVR